MQHDFAGNVGRAVREARRSRRMLQKDVAATIGVSAQFLCDVEKGRRNTTRMQRLRLASALDISPFVLDILAGELPVFDWDKVPTTPPPAASLAEAIAREFNHLPSNGLKEAPRV